MKTSEQDQSESYISKTLAPRPSPVGVVEKLACLIWVIITTDRPSINEKSPPESTFTKSFFRISGKVSWAI